MPRRYRVLQPGLLAWATLAAQNRAHLSLKSTRAKFPDRNGGHIWEYPNVWWPWTSWWQEAKGKFWDIQLRKEPESWGKEHQLKKGSRSGTCQAAVNGYNLAWPQQLQKKGGDVGKLPEHCKRQGDSHMRQTYMAKQPLFNKKVVENPQQIWYVPFFTWVIHSCKRWCQKFVPVFRSPLIQS